jgi:hypothetical protein
MRPRWELLFKRRQVFRATRCPKENVEAIDRTLVLVSRTTPMPYADVAVRTYGGKRAKKADSLSRFRFGQ